MEGSHSYVRTCPSVIQKIKDSDPYEFPSTFYKKSLSSTSCHSTLNPVLQIRNTRQVINHKSIRRQKSRLTHDGLYNIHEIAFDLDGFVSKIITFPDLVIVCGHPKLLMEMNNLLQIGAIHGQLFSYDTTFELGDVYICISPSYASHPLSRCSSDTSKHFITQKKTGIFSQRINEIYFYQFSNFR